MKICNEFESIGRSYGKFFSENMMFGDDPNECNIDEDIIKYEHIYNEFFDTINSYMDKIKKYNLEMSKKKSILNAIIDFIYDKYGKNYINDHKIELDKNHKCFQNFENGFVNEVKRIIISDDLFLDIFDNYIIENCIDLENIIFK